IAALMIASGDLLTEYPVVSTKLYKPPPLPGASVKVLPVVATEAEPIVVVTEEKPRPPTVACGPSIERPRANLPPKSFTMRKAYWRAHVKPTTYCGSMIMGRSSWRFWIPFLSVVAKVHIWPPVKLQPLSKAACA